MESVPNKCHDKQDGKTESQPRLIAIQETLESFHDDVEYLWGCSDIKVYEEPPSPLEFLRNHVALSKPCIIRNSILCEKKKTTKEEGENEQGRDASHIPLTMTLDDLVRLFPQACENRKEKTQHSGVSAQPSESGSPPSTPPFSLPHLCVDVTPDGHGDCLRSVRISDGKEQKVFVKPMERSMGLSEFSRRLRNGRAKQRQQHSRFMQPEDILESVFESSTGGQQSENEAESRDDSDVWFEDCVLYYSRQNDCLRKELTPLWNLKRNSIGNYCDCDTGGSFVFPRSFPWAEEAFFGESNSCSSTSGIGPEAVNLWIGDERAVSAMHKDHYENLFYVLSGEKVFGLCPPSDAPFLCEREVCSGRFQVSAGKWAVQLDRDGDSADPLSDRNISKVHWITTDLFGSRSRNPCDTDAESKRNSPLSNYAHPITVRVRAGELLYLPSLWFHRVTQTRETIGINYWYDMKFESPLWCYFHFLQQLRSPSC